MADMLEMPLLMIKYLKIPLICASSLRSERLLSPLVLFHDLCFLLWREIVLDVEKLSDLGDGPVLDQARDLGAGELQQGLDIKIVGCEDQLE